MDQSESRHRSFFLDTPNSLPAPLSPEEFDRKTRRESAFVTLRAIDRNIRWRERLLRIYQEELGILNRQKEELVERHPGLVPGGEPEPAESPNGAPTVD